MNNRFISIRIFFISLFVVSFVLFSMFFFIRKILESHSIQVAVFYLLNWNNDFERRKKTHSHFIFYKEYWQMFGHVCVPCVDTWHFCFRLHMYKFHLNIASGSVEMSVLSSNWCCSWRIIWQTIINIVEHSRSCVCSLLIA